MPRRKPRIPDSPLDQRDGIDPVHLRLPVDGSWATVRDHLVDRLPVDAGVVDALLAAGEVAGVDGPLSGDSPYAPGAHVWFHRPLAPEPRVPFPLRVLYRDTHLLVVDKPHFLATTPRGSHITETALARLRRELDLPRLSPAHRLDRLTAGLVLFTLRPADRGAYQGLFADKRVHKEYEAIAPYDPALELPRTVRSRIVKDRGIIAAYEAPGEPNSESRIELLDHRTHGPGTEAAPLARYRLLPRTGRTHQLRVHMNALGVPILGDPVYPRLTDPAPDDYSRPLQLLARTLEFTDPLTGRAHRFESERTLQAWTDHEGWASGGATR
ncbi:RluA family pseudouridine synthase [Streptomyces sp. B-S-A8]|uniref:RNA pseudouridylate synthase n=1 Tax=Streptomyces solicavernae TaxID=3043614 RepID=A0ABT6RR06_9ACTN|nr:RluA family pseudouridine synthase [Streptomyces sp. B-S-A8]MDI3386871.1 RluA family pseudouridine synthase [Streptomyces sp. B-S-A8]